MTFWDGTQYILPSVSVMLGNGDGTFQTAVSYFLSIYANTSVSPNKVAVADVNGDDRPEVIVSSGVARDPRAFVDDYRGGVSVLVNHGDGTFADPVLYDSGGYVGARAIAADVNGDSTPDIVPSTTVPRSGPPAIVSGHANGIRAGHRMGRIHRELSACYSATATARSSRRLPILRVGLSPARSPRPT